MEAPKLTIRRARDLRRRLTLPEVVLWTALRGRRLGGLRFRRQHPIGPYIVDFFCPALRLALEVDGRVHEHPDSLRHDRRRTDWLNERGVEVFRISARAVLENLDGVLLVIRQRAGGPLHHAPHGPPPPVGED
ncbi:endonuclease domain-containing protein [Brevundimonas sp.]|uniref:endonuclease domain-containing protein n=1 Tax=Brevundimonas sp. TaxID=1871086 RepID=UPI00272F0320|nr:endonuclease domain-containing protein [Brevundimonas sp.]MDP1914545.1 endonuclease domain-containing protein [Brevundimonas sp.]